MKLRKTSLAAAVLLTVISGVAASVHADVVPYSNAPLLVQRQHPVVLPDNPIPALHCPAKIGCTPGHTFFYRIPATGQPPLAFKAAGLPAGVSLDPTTGVLTGECAAKETDTATITVTNAKGAASMALTIVCAAGSHSLTPPMGWTPLGLYAETEDDAKIRAAADALNSTGLAAHGWRVLLVDDSWQGSRSPSGMMLPNQRFPDMKALGTYIHGKGLQFGIYSAPTQHSCSGYTGSLGHEADDARLFASWGIDYLKYEWCPVDIDTQAAPTDEQAAFTLMRSKLDATSRDVTYAISTNGRQGPWNWADAAGADTFTIGGVVPDDWQTYTSSLIRYIGISEIAPAGHWIEPGPLLIGRSDYGNLHRSNFTPSEQMFQMSLLCLLPAPLFINCDLQNLNANKFDKTTTAILTNDEIIAVDQDALGAAGLEMSAGPGADCWYKPLSDGTVAIGLFNKSMLPEQGDIRLADIGLSGPQPVRDLWLHKDLDAATDSISMQVPPESVIVLKVGKPGAAK
jgi:alpha-galactosidase